MFNVKFYAPVFIVDVVKCDFEAKQRVHSFVDGKTVGNYILHVNYLVTFNVVQK